MSQQAQTLVDKVWDRHIVSEQPDRPSMIYIDLHLIHEVTSPQAFAALEERGLKLRQPERTVATMDHSTPTDPRRLEVLDGQSRKQLDLLRRNCEKYGVTLYGLGHNRNGIVHVIGPELGLTQPGMTIVCGDSHTSTHGAFGALAFGIGTTEVSHVLATQCLLQHRPKSFEVRVDGELPEGVGAKDIALAIIAEIGTDGGTGHVFEFRGSAIEALSMEGRMTLCNMSIEAGARAGLVAPDEKTFAYLEGRDFAPKGAAWQAAVADWRSLSTDEGATFSRSLTLDASKLAPMITFGTNPGMGQAIDKDLPRPEDLGSDQAAAELQKALDYMGLESGKALLGHPVDVVFIGSCTNSRISDLREAAEIFKGRQVAEGVRTLVVPGSQDIKRQAEAEGLDAVFRAAGAEWREPGCSMCIAMNGDQLSPGQYAVSTSNRNFEGRQGRGGRTFLASPRTAAAAAIKGCVTDPRTVKAG